MQLDNLQINNDGEITMSTALALWTEKIWKRNWQFATPGGRVAGGRVVAVGPWGTMGMRDFEGSWCLSLFSQSKLMMAGLGRRGFVQSSRGTTFLQTLPS